MAKKTGFIGAILASFAAFLSLNLISAFYYDPRQGMNDLIRYVTDFLEPLFNALLGGPTGGWTSYLLFEKILLFVILIALVYLSLKNVELFSNNAAVLWIIAIAVPLLGVRFLDFEWLNTIFVQYKVIAFVLTAGLPFIIYFLFLYNVLGDYDAMRKIGWIFFGVVFLFMWASSTDPTFSEVYFWTAAIAFLFLLFDGTIRRTMVKMQYRALGYNRREDLARGIRRDISQADSDYAKDIINEKQYKRIKARLQRQLETIMQN